jgi:hypothetical protein
MKTYGVMAAFLVFLSYQYSLAQAPQVLAPDPGQGRVVLTVRVIPASGASQASVIPASLGNQIRYGAINGQGASTVNPGARSEHEILTDMYREKHETPFWKR